MPPVDFNPLPIVPVSGGDDNYGGLAPPLPPSPINSITCDNPPIGPQEEEDFDDFDPSNSIVATSVLRDHLEHFGLIATRTRNEK